MLTLLAHSSGTAWRAGWTSWNADPVLLAALAVAACLYLRGLASQRRRSGNTQPLLFLLGLGAVAVALVSPLYAMADGLASAHMVQHMLLIVVAAPLLALSAPSTTLAKGTPVGIRRLAAHALAGAGLPAARLRRLRHPTAVWLLHAGSIWFWHASVPYEAALANDAVHGVEHAAFLLPAYAFWSLIAGPGRTAPSYGYRIVLVFAAAMQGVLLGALMTFARTAWYPGYAGTTAAYGLDPLADQQLAGAIMWVPGGLVYTAAAAALIAAWLRQADADANERVGGRPRMSP